jgi:hypothetical protein
MKRFWLIWAVVLILGGTVEAQQPTPIPGQNRGCFQTIVIKDLQTNRIREFTRWGHKKYGEWNECTPFPHAVTNTIILKEWPVTPKELRKAIGDKLYNFLDKHRTVTLSGHFNLSGDHRFDYENFAGDTYTTKDMRRGRVPVELLGKRQEVDKLIGKRR